LFRLRLLFILIGILAAGWFAFAIADPETASAEALLPIALMLWAALALAIGYTLAVLPPSVALRDGFRLRLKKRFYQFSYGLAVLAMLGLGGLTLFLSLRALNLVGT